MSFAAPAYLAALALLPAAALAYAAARRRRRRFAVRFPAAATLAAIAVQAPAWRRHVPPLMLTLAAAALVLALARPQATVAVPVERASVVLVMDASRSMIADDVPPSRLEAARRAALHFLDRVPKTLNIGFVSYSTTPQTVIEPTLDHVATRVALEALQADGGTATGDALDAALDMIEQRRAKDRRRAPAVIVLLSDGKTTAGSDPLVAARRARQLRVPVSTVALGTENGVVYGGPFSAPVQVPPDPETLRLIARTSGGTAFEVDDADELDRIYERLGSQIGTKRERREVTAAFAGGGLVLLLGALGLGLRWRGRLP